MNGSSAQDTWSSLADPECCRVHLLFVLFFFLGGGEYENIYPDKSGGQQMI